MPSQTTIIQKGEVASKIAEKALEIGEKAFEKQFEIMEEQQQKAGEFIDKKVIYICHVLCSTTFAIY